MAGTTLEAPLDLAAPADAGSERAAAESCRERLASLPGDEFAGVWRLVRRCGVPESPADDAAQDVFIVAARKLNESELGKERRYLYGVAIRVAANARRAHATRAEQPDSDALDAA